VTDLIADLQLPVKDAASLLTLLGDPARTQALLAALDDRLKRIAQAQVTKQEAEDLKKEATGLLWQNQQDRVLLQRQKDAQNEAARIWGESTAQQRKQLEDRLAEVEEGVKLNNKRETELRARADALSALEAQFKTREAALEKNEADYEQRRKKMRDLAGA
jgi:hypothetical protein